MTDQAYEVLETSRRYVLAEDSDGYAIRDRLRGNDVVERFPPTEEGVDLALARLDELKRSDRRDRWSLPRIGLFVAVIGAGVWVLAGTLLAVLFTFEGPQVYEWIPQTLFGLDQLGFRLAMGSLVVAGVYALLRWIQPAENRVFAPPPSLVEDPNRGWDMVLRTALITGLVVWTVSSITTEALFRFEFGLEGPNPSREAIAAQLISTLAFRVWVTALILMVLRRLRPIPPPSAGSKSDGG